MTFVGLGIILDDKKLLVILRPKHKKHYPNMWNIPGGRSDPSETPEQTTTREVKEETGLDFKPSKLLYEEQGSIYYKYYFLGEWTGKIKPDTSEVAEYKWYTYEEARELYTRKSFQKLLEKLREENLL